MQNENTRGLETPARQEVSRVPVRSGTRAGPSESRPRAAVSVVPEPDGTSRTRLMSGTVFGTGMATTSQLEESDPKVVYRTVQESPGLLGRMVGPSFSSREEAKRVAERFAEENLNAAPTGWEEIDDGSGAVTMTPASTRFKLTVEPVTIHESADQLAGGFGGEDG